MSRAEVVRRVAAAPRGVPLRARRCRGSGQGDCVIGSRETQLESCLRCGNLVERKGGDLADLCALRTAAPRPTPALQPGVARRRRSPSPRSPTPNRIRTRMKATTLLALPLIGLALGTAVGVCRAEAPSSHAVQAPDSAPSPDQVLLAAAAKGDVQAIRRLSSAGAELQTALSGAGSE